jgi:environmental stress-induced protein Ves
MTVQVLRAGERPAVPWLNGGGVTREVAGGPAGSGMADFDWRVSLADVDRGGPFSLFPGVDRVITLVEGEGMVLTVAGAEQAVTVPFRPFAFPGDAATDCRLAAGPVVDFNVMTRRGRTAADVEIADAGRAVDVPDDAVLLAVCLAGSAALGSAGVRLDRYDAVLLTAGTDRLEVDGVTALVTLRRTV